MNRILLVRDMLVNGKPENDAQQDTNQDSLTLKVRLEPDDSVPEYYVNFVDVSHGPFDIGLLLGRLPTKLSAEEMENAQTSGQLVRRPVAEVIMTPDVARGLIKALSEQVQKYEKSFGPGSKADEGNA